MHSFFLLENRRYPALDGLRALATLMIFNVHFFAQYSDQNYFLQSDSLGYQLMRTIHSGSLGVDILFVLSGFLTFLSLAKHGTMQAHSFMIQRFKRMLPVIMLVNLPALCWGANTVGWHQLVDNIFLFKLFPETTLITYITWALVYEMWFYLFFSVVFILPSRWTFARSLTFFWTVSLALTLNVLFSRRFDALCDPRFLNFMVGILLAMLFSKGKARSLLDPLSRAAWLPALAFLFAACWVWPTRPFTQAMGASPALRWGFHLLLALAMGLLLWRLLQPGRVTRFFSSKSLRALGVVSFSLFMTHAQWGLTIGNTLQGGAHSFLGLMLAWVLSLSISFLLAVLFYAFLERPYFVKPDA